jgi:hypothetical protein
MRPVNRLTSAGALALAAAALVPAAAAARTGPSVVMLENCSADCMMAGPGRISGEQMSDLMNPFGPVEAATRRQRLRAWRLLHRVRSAGHQRFATEARARALHYRRGHAMAAVGQRHGAHFIHYDNWALRHDSHVLDPRRPESLVYWEGPTGVPVLVGMMFRVSTAVHAPRRGLGPLVRWHAHALCDRHKRSSPRQFSVPGHCGSAQLAHYGPTAMVHVWLTRDLTSAYAQKAPAQALQILLSNPDPAT